MPSPLGCTGVFLDGVCPEPLGLFLLLVHFDAGESSPFNSDLKEVFAFISHVRVVAFKWLSHSTVHGFPVSQRASAPEARFKSWKWVKAQAVDVEGTLIRFLHSSWPRVIVGVVG